MRDAKKGTGKKDMGMISSSMPTIGCVLRSQSTKTPTY